MQRVWLYCWGSEMCLGRRKKQKMKKRAALLVDNLHLSKWQSEAMEAASDLIEIVVVLNCQNTKNKKQYFKNFMYYILNILTLKNHLTRTSAVMFSDAAIIDFESIYKGAWQSLPGKIYKELKDGNIDVVIKFGMSLLHLDERKSLPPILSYHHGDPSKYRGRPAGFYEILNNEKTTGIIVQALSNKLDAGEIFAFAESKVVNFSYKKTAINFYSYSIPLLRKAIINLSCNSPVVRDVDGANYRLPSNVKVTSFIFVLILNAFKKLVYGLFFEKKWKVATTKNTLNLKQTEVLSAHEFNEVPIDKRYNFYADPFFSENGKKIRLEALDNKTGLGDIVEVESSDYTKQATLISGEHLSYPCSFTFKGKEYLLPEVASHSAQYFCEINKFDEQHFLKGLEDKRIVDATLLFTDEKYFLFFGENQTAHTLLNLWMADSPYDVFEPHPSSPIVISPWEARMGGKIVDYQGKLLRFGQNNSGEYGESLAIMDITKLTAASYEEVNLGMISIDNFSGPHSIGFNHDKTTLLIDYYRNEFSLLAGLRRIKARLHRK
jgi:hypothetical protein